MLVVCVALMLGWWMDRSKVLREFASSGAARGADWGFIGSRWDFVTNNISGALPYTLASDGDLTYITLRGERYTDDWLPALRRCRNLNSLHLVQAPITNAGLEEIGNLPASLKMVSLCSCDAVTDEGLRHLGQQPSILRLHLEDIQLHSEGIEHLAQLPSLTSLIITNCGSFDGRNLVHLQQCKQLEWLDLRGSSITDADLERLVGLPALKEVLLSNTRVTPAGVAKLKTAAPQLGVAY
jgi:Leucine Rich Repeat (LRR) protein